MDERRYIFASFAKKAMAKIEEKKKRKKKTFYSEELDMEVEIRGLSSEELMECSEYSESALVVDKYTLYYASKSLQELAGYMMEEGMIENHLQVIDIFEVADINYLVKEVLKLSGMTQKSSFSEVEEIKKN